MAVQFKEKIIVAGAGPVGCLLATLLARRGMEVEVYEKRPDLRRASLAGGRSINLVLTDRGLRALRRLGLNEPVQELTVPVLGRMMHSIEGELAYQPYGKDDSEHNHSVSRGELNKFLLDAAEEAGVVIHFEHPITGADFEAQKLVVQPPTGSPKQVPFHVVLGCDGAPSAIRQALVDAGHADAQVSFMQWGYKELLFPAGPDGDYRAAGHALHIWPRGAHFLMALANLDGSFTGTLYMPTTGPQSFEALDDPAKIEAFFTNYYPDAIELLGDYAEELLAHPTGMLGTVRCATWHLDDRVLLLGDAAHGIVPFFGQGLNSGFEDCTVFDELLDKEDSMADLFARFFERRKPNADAIADMALENAVEMGEKVADPNFLLRKKVEAKIEQHMPEIYRSRYAMVMYSHIPYAKAFALGEVQQTLLSTLTADLDDAEDLDLDHARQLIEERFSPEVERLGVDLHF